ncbi:hypothetical protein A11M_0107695 [Xanthomonas vasicola pv. vasculorum NCPPB 895]|uniref:Uncharacterized protein n=1 Tax=Xanthomonas vasicola pv. vasculorum NCPPB 890 TaxID=1184265 RepID=A0A837AP88_XANVA|nr:hypothetical protein A11M_0107695 [Xanthomonas vasicola pv. vasculorum NCPPB 895]KFA26121.1 hypothetical protein KWS_0119305 [Xanthomonas vasicola pv. musacearum NCPPB 4384]KGR53992.1 hypothetical protein NX09_13820 [Xanthomonas vasicola]KGR54053.1 hypothetical protein NX07_05685 [Xanthomonas vasicola]KGT84937.1 hypothetical protein OC00_05635 [Xanthomonas vasicola]
MSQHPTAGYHAGGFFWQQERGDAADLATRVGTGGDVVHDDGRLGASACSGRAIHTCIGAD